MLEDNKLKVHTIAEAVSQSDSDFEWSLRYEQPIRNIRNTVWCYYPAKSFMKKAEVGLSTEMDIAIF